MKKGSTVKELCTCTVLREARGQLVMGQLVIHQLFHNSCTTLKDLFSSQPTAPGGEDDGKRMQTAL